MIYLAGAGKDYLAARGEISDLEYRLLDSDETKIGNEIAGKKVEEYKILAEATSTDKVLVTSKKYFQEIFEIIRKYSSDISIELLPEYLWRQKVVRIPDYLNSIKQYCVDAPINDWIDSAIVDELSYWKISIAEAKERGDYRLCEREFEYCCNSELEFEIDDLVIDVGCGPLPKFGNKLNCGRVNYQPVDPLAHQYEKILKESDVKLPVTPKFAMAEFLTLFYKENSADYIIIHNALDHTYDIMRALVEMLRVVKLDGYVLMYHMDSEGIFENYSGMHQWNITENHGDLYFFNKEYGINVTEAISEFADIIIKRNTVAYRDEIIVAIKKKKNVPIDIINKYDDELVAGRLISALFKRML